jgi:hypothetical protein
MRARRPSTSSGQKQASEALHIPRIRYWFSFRPNGMKCHLGHTVCPCRFCTRSRGYARFAARVPRALDRAQNRRHRPEFRDVGAGGTRAPGERFSANGGMVRHGAANGGTGMSSEPERARLKDVRTRPANPLSAHHYFGALCRKLWCTVFCYSPVFVGLS